MEQEPVVRMFSLSSTLKTGVRLDMLEAWHIAMHLHALFMIFL